jgi:DNA polymerase-3 subunit epsilon
MRQCTKKLSKKTTSPACALAELGRCPAPCEHGISVDEYEARAAEPFRTATRADPAEVVEQLMARIEKLANDQRYEDAAAVRARLTAFLRATVRMQRLAGLTTLTEVVAARPGASGGWELSIVRRGRLVAAGVSPAGEHPRRTIDMLLSTAETVLPGPGPVPAATPEESERILAWFERPETRLVRVEARDAHGWASPARGAGRWRTLLAMADAAMSARLDHDESGRSHRR